jgi:hypothetical protein
MSHCKLCIASYTPRLCTCAGTATRDRCYDFLNIFAKNFGENIGVLDLKQSIITLVFEKNANFFAEIFQKSQKIVIITSTPDVSREKKSTKGLQKSAKM